MTGARWGLKTVNLNRFVGAAALVVTSVAMSSAITFWAVRDQDQVTQDEIRLIVEGAAERLRNINYLDTTPSAASREAEQALAVQAVQQGVAGHRVIFTSEAQPRSKALLVHRFTVTDRDDEHPACLVLTQQREVTEPGHGFYVPSLEDGRCRDPRAKGDD